MIKALVFDVYGTLLDTRTCSLIIMKDVLRNCNCNLKPEFVYKEWRKNIEKMIIKMNSENKFKVERVFFKEALGKTLKRLRIMASEHEKMNLYGELCWGNRGIFSETKDALKSLSKKYRIITASNSDTKPLLVDFQRHKLKVDKIVTSEMLKFYKPHKRFFEKLLMKIKVSKEEIVYIGDSLENDIKGSHKVGIKAVWINRKNKKRKTKDTKPDYVINNLKELIMISFS